MEMTLGELLNQIILGCGDMDEAEVMKLPIKVSVPHSCGQYSHIAQVRGADVNLKGDNVMKKNIGEITINGGYIS